jgi:hypothetical protein
VTGWRIHAGVALLLSLAMPAGCADVPERLEMTADAVREFASSHPVIAESALVAARTALHKSQRLRVVCDPHCRATTVPDPGVPAAHPAG